jgi:hypothetical protein
LTGTLTGTSVGMINDMIQGKMPMIPDSAVGMVSFLGRKVGNDNRLTKGVLGWEPTPIETSIEDMAKSIT